MVRRHDWQWQRARIYTHGINLGHCYQMISGKRSSLVRSIAACFPRGWSKSGANFELTNQWLLLDVFWRYPYLGGIFKNLRKWEVVDEPVLSPRPGSFDSHLVEPGPPPILLPEGIWLGYNGADDNLRYGFGQALFAVDNPRKLIRRCTRPLLEPTTENENKGQVPRVSFSAKVWCRLKENGFSITEWLTPESE